ncbi:MAG: hypothetical protein CVT49_00070 [candidate division Zixibacteria bacterium HGW-Zixibacteria-1]|nr:MAG: hypothetical protein CVT49_00070 [candidate division Zixibacteria bacterium HGW-Zixibacteria-1]
MKRVTLLFLFTAFIITGTAFAADIIKVDRDFGPSFYGYAQNKCLVVVKDGTPSMYAQSRAGLAITGNAAIDEIANNFKVHGFAKQFPAADQASLTHPSDKPLTRHYIAEFPHGNLDAVMEAYSRLPFVEKVEPIGLYYMSASPVDRYYDDPPETFPYDQWHYWDTYGISADLAWDKETGDPNVVVAVIDGGVRYYHYDLGGTNPPGPTDNSTNGNIWVNNGEIPGNGIDDDNNGYIDDVVGWDFVTTSSQCNDVDCTTADNDPADCAGHGTHVAGTIAAITNNDPTFGVAGIAGGWNDGTTNFTSNGVKIMCLRAGWKSPLGGLMSMDYCAQAMYYVATMVDKGVNVAAINCSWGSSSYIGPAVNAVLARDVMVIVAAGNDNTSNYDYLGGRADCMDVGATDQSGNPASFSTYGSWVDIAAPGVEILSTYHNSDDPTGDYIALMDGTSMACPHVVGVAALLESYNPALTGPEKFAIITDPNNVKWYNPTKYVGVGIIDARKCIDAAGPACDVTADFSGTPTSGCAPMTVNFTDLSTGPVTSWSWTFGDGGTSAAANPSHQYTTAGTYTVSLTVTSAACNDTETKTGYITVSSAVTANFSGTPTSGNAPLTVNFTDLSTGNPTAWSWTFGDGGTAAVKNPSHQYTTAGTYTVTLTASNACGSDIETKTNYITVTEPVGCVMHVQDIQVIRIPSGRNCTGRATIYIYDAYNQPVSNATVYVSVTGNTTESKTGTTASDGSVVITTLKTKSCSGEWCFEVTNVTHATCTYNSSANLVTKSCESGDVYKLQNGIIPYEFSLSNYPNPFNPTTTIEMSLPVASEWNINIYNIAGQKVAGFNGFSNAGVVSINWDASQQASGIYFMKATAGEYTADKKMVLMK